MPYKFRTVMLTVAMLVLTVPTAAQAIDGPPPVIRVVPAEMSSRYSCFAINANRRVSFTYMVLVRRKHRSRIEIVGSHWLVPARGDVNRHLTRSAWGARSPSKLARYGTLCIGHRWRSGRKVAVRMWVGDRLYPPQDEFNFVLER